jgi:hypothetical protein
LSYNASWKPFCEVAASRDEQLAQAASLKGATLPDGTAHE